MTGGGGSGKGKSGSGSRGKSVTMARGSGKCGNGGKIVTATWTNKQGNTCTQYSDGGYRYSNSSGSSYYNTGRGHSFFSSGSKGTQGSGGVPYSTHTNYNQGYSTTKYKR